MIETEVNRFAVNPFGKRIEVERIPEKTEKIEMDLDEKVEKTLEQYIKFISSADIVFQHGLNEENWSIMYDELYDKLETLTPEQIDLTLQLLISAHGANENLIGDYITTLIKKSYDSGHVNFHLTTNDFTINNLGFKLKGDKSFSLLDLKQKSASIQDFLCSQFLYKKKQINLIITGNAGYNLGGESVNCSYTVYGNASSRLGEKSTNSLFHIYGSVGRDCGDSSKNSSYIIDGNVNNICGLWSRKCKFTIEGNLNWGQDHIIMPGGIIYQLEGTFTGEHPPYNGCIIRTTNNNIYDQYADWLKNPEYPEFQLIKIQLADKKGKIIQEVVSKAWQ